MNFCALTPTGASMFDALNCSGMREDGEGIAALLGEQAKQMTDGNPVRLTGWVLDNTKANCSAMQQLQRQYPEWVMRGCFAHGLSLAMKDFTTFTKGVYNKLLKTCNVAPNPKKKQFAILFTLHAFLARITCLQSQKSLNLSFSFRSR
jgi:hypothetical protein